MINSRISLIIVAMLAVTVVYTFASIVNAAPAKITVSSPNVNVALASGAENEITWTTTEYPVNTGVTINLIKRVDESPIRYELVRTIALNTPNDGSESWEPARNESGKDFFIEVACSGGTIAAGCQADITNAAIAINTGNTNFANISQSVVDLINLLKRILGL